MDVHLWHQDDVEIVPMDRQHIPALAQLEETCFSQPWSYDSLRQELSNPLAVFRVALLGEEVVGYVGMYHIVDEGNITNIAVSPDHRRKGIGQALMKSLFQYGKEQEMQAIYLEGRESNEGAIAFYEDLHFQVTGRRKGFYSFPKEDALLMTHEF